MLGFEEVEKYDPELAQAMSDELTRQRTHIELIASENLVSKAVMAAMGSVLTNKYAEGYPGKRYYGGCEYVDATAEKPGQWRLPRSDSLPRMSTSASRADSWIRWSAP